MDSTPTIAKVPLKLIDSKTMARCSQSSKLINCDSAKLI